MKPNNHHIARANRTLVLNDIARGYFGSLIDRHIKKNIKGCG